MPEVRISVGGRDFDVACQDGEEIYLQTAANLLDKEASALVEQVGRLPEARMLLMAGLMLADKTAGMEDQLRTMQDTIARSERQIAELNSRPAPEPEKVEVAVIPTQVSETLAEMAARTESIAAALEEKLG